MNPQPPAIYETDILLSDCWAKTHPETGLPALTVRDHCLAVGVVAKLARALLPAACHHLPPGGAEALVAAHDIGKITPGFQAKCSHSPVCALPGVCSLEGNHAKVSQSFLASLATMTGPDGAPLAWSLAADGHHGSYDRSYPANLFGKRYGGISEVPWTWPDELRRELMRLLVEMLGNLPSDLVHVGARLHWMTGFTTFCDWIGSNTDWFPLPDDGILKDRWDLPQAESLAAAALNTIGWHRRATRPGLDFSGLFGLQPRPLQETLMRLAEKPGLFIVEAPMGCGKTEAALAAAYQRWQSGDERGLYFALPTQLTSNRIHDRIGRFLAKVVADETAAALIHGNAWLREDRILRFSPAPDGDDAGNAATTRDWFAGSRRALLAPFGTGTVDQALMARVAAKHSALRLFALSGKVVVIDEVHSYDPYASRLLDALIAWLLECGCTIIVLSATLTAARRASLVAAAGATEPTPTPTAYPLITRVSGGVSEHHPVADDSIHDRQVRLRHFMDGDGVVLAEATKAAENGACVLVIRNTVERAKETFRQMKCRIRDGAARIGLLHSRFPQFRRDQNEQEWMDLLGHYGTRRPHGCVLVATQVVEQSVDIDADLLITDLAPTDLLLQRMGRLHRHQRPRPPGYEQPACWIVHPTVDWHGSAKEIRKSLGPAGRVYPPSALYQSGRVWRARTAVRLPGEIRELLESTHAMVSNLPAGVADLLRELEVQVNNLDLQAGNRNPFHNPSLNDIEGCQTRWITLQTTPLVLLAGMPERHGDRMTVKPLDGDPVTFQAGRFHYPLAVALHRNAVRVPAYVLRDAHARQPDWLGSVLSGGVAAVVSPTSALVEILEVPESAYQLSYHPEEGVGWVRRKDRRSDRPCEDEDDGWF